MTISSSPHGSVSVQGQNCLNPTDFDLGGNTGGGDPRCYLYAVSSAYTSHYLLTFATATQFAGLGQHVSSLTAEQIIGFKKVDSLSNLLSDVADVYIGFLYFATFADHCPLLGETLGTFFASPHLHHSQISDHCAHPGCHCAGMVPIFILWICVHVLSDPGQLAPGDPCKVWKFGNI